MDPGQSDIIISAVVTPIAGRDQGKLFYVIGTDPVYLTLVNGKNRTLDKPKLKKRKHVKEVLRPETRVALKIQNGDKVLNSELRRDLAFFSRALQSNE